MSLLSSLSLKAQTGLQICPPEEFEKLERWQPDLDYGFSSSYAVDLRQSMPSVGKQSMNDCAAWAAAYTIRSYQEAIDQNWKADHPSRIFSPLFLYNGINGGRDKGSSLLNACLFMKNMGTATLATAPYLEKNFTQRPTQEAIREASQFKIHDFKSIYNMSQMRAALAQGNPILIGARLSKIFCGGLYDTYTRDYHLSGLRDHDPKMPHAMHAMAVVGYDDRKQAFLIMNSWGKEWGHEGFCWVHYDLMREADYRMRDPNSFLITAFVLEDERRPVKPRQEVEPLPDQEEHAPITSEIKNRYLGLNKEGKPEWLITARIKSDLADIQSVTWSIKHRKGGISLIKTITRAHTGFQFSGFLHQAGEYSIEAEVMRSNGSSNRIQTTHKLEAPMDTLAIKYFDRYYGRGKLREVSGNWWKYFVWIDGDQSRARDIATVRWVIYANNRKDWLRQETSDLAKTPGNTMIIGYFSGPTTVHAYVTFTDGSKTKYSRIIRPYAAKNDRIKMIHKYDVNYASKDGKRKTTLNWLDGPWKDMKDIKEVLYWNPHEKDWIRVKYSVGQHLWGFPAYTRSYVTHALIRYKNGDEEKVTSEGWVTGKEKLPVISR